METMERPAPEWGRPFRVAVHSPWLVASFLAGLSPNPGHGTRGLMVSPPPILGEGAGGEGP